MANEGAPNTKTLNIPWLALCTRADPDIHRERRDQVEYEFAGGRRIFRGDPLTRGPYADD